MPADRSRCWPGCMSAASNCSAKRHPQHRRAEGQDRRRAGVRLEPARVADCDGRPCRARPGQGHPLGHRPRRSSRSSCSQRARSMRFLGFPPEPQDLRARHIGHVIVNSCRRPPVVAVFLLHAGGQPRIRPQKSGRDQARVARHSQGRGSLRQRAGAASRNGSSMAGSPTALRLCPADAERAALRQMARIRSRGHDPVLCPAPARSRLHQVEPAEDHRRRHRLALSRTSSNAS